MAAFNYPQYTVPYLDTTTSYCNLDSNNNYEEEDYYYSLDSNNNCDNNYEDYKTALQTVHITLSSTLTFLTHLLHSFNDDIQSLTYISEDTIDHLWKAKISTWSSITFSGTWENQDNASRENRGICPWIRKLRAFFTDHNHSHSHRDKHNNYRNRGNVKGKKATDHLSMLETDLTRAITTPWPPQGTTYAPDSVIYSDLSLDSLYDRLVVTLEYFPVSMEYRRVKEVVTALELVQIVMDRTAFLWSSSSFSSSSSSTG